MDYDKSYFMNKTAVVTGAASGIGLALVEELLKCDGSKVVMADINQARLDEEEKRLHQEYGDRIKGILCDITVEENVQELISKSKDFFGGKFDLLFNNAGASFDGAFADLDVADWKAAFDLNFFGALHGIRAVLPIMVKQGSGQIINIISGIAFAPMPYQTRYSATKSALNALSLSLRTEYWDDNIKISSATPGTTATDIFKNIGIPENAQQPNESASRILNGTVNNERIIFGSEADANGGQYGAHPLAHEENDKYFLNVARERREGKSGF